MTNATNLRQTLTAIQPLLTKVVAVHGEHEPRLHAVAEAFSELGRRSEDPGEVTRLVGLLREQTSGYATPEWGCRSYRLLMGQLAELETAVLPSRLP